MDRGNTGDVAVVIDYENLYYSVTQCYSGYPNLEQIIEAAEKYGRVASCQAFADWGQFQRSLSFLLRAGIQPVFCPSVATDPNQQQEKKSSVDPTMCVYAMKLLYTCPNLHTLVLVTGDRDFIPLVMEARQMGRKVVVLGIGRTMSSDLAALADDVVLYRDLVENVETKGARNDVSRIKSAEDVYPTLTEIIKEARKLGKTTTLGYVKLCLKDRIHGFDETTLEDAKGRKFKRFKDFIIDAVGKGKVKLNTAGSANEVYLPDETPRTRNTATRKNGQNAAPEPSRPQRQKAGKNYVKPQEDIVSAVQSVMPKDNVGLAFTRIKQSLAERKRNGTLEHTHTEIDSSLKGCIHFGLLSGEKVRGVMVYQLADDWQERLTAIEDPAPSQQGGADEKGATSAAEAGAGEKGATSTAEAGAGEKGVTSTAEGATEAAGGKTPAKRRGKANKPSRA